MTHGSELLASHPGYHTTVKPDGRLTLGVLWPLESYDVVSTMDDDIELARLVDLLGFAALWFHDVPLFDPTFGDAYHLPRSLP